MTAGPPGDGEDGDADRPAGSDASGVQTIRDLVDLTHDREGTAMVSPERATDYSARDFATAVRKTANLLSHYGAGPDRPVAVAIGPKDPASDGTPGWLGSAADPLLALLGAMTLGAPADPAPAIDGPVEAPVLVAPAAWLDRYEVDPGTSVLAYGGPPEAPAVGHFERERWSENPTAPPEALPADRTALRTQGHAYTHATLLGAARSVLAGGALDDAVRIEVATPVDTARPFVAGVLVPLLCGVPLEPVRAAAVGNATGEEARRGVFVVTADAVRRPLDIPRLD